MQFRNRHPDGLYWHPPWSHSITFNALAVPIRSVLSVLHHTRVLDGILIFSCLQVVARRVDSIFIWVCRLTVICYMKLLNSQKEKRKKKHILNHFKSILYICIIYNIINLEVIFIFKFWYIYLRLRKKFLTLTHCSFNLSYKTS